ncbi:M1 family aminopeptidase [Mesonia aquimarina]|uniref:M1 family aminopeptidase n=1 Tax=Mesonia aquimarina TaxID=1504967 RepID=UPI000EF587C8|nr:M1 family aminopeptidase [Mesonia aquimarina]
MKYILYFFACLFSSQLMAQSFNMDELIEVESKSAQARMNFSTNSNTANYDLTYHRLELEVDPLQAFISGEITSYFIAKEDLTEVVFDLASNMNVSGVEQDGVSLSYSHTGDELIIDLPQTQTQGTLDSLSVSYSGNPVSSGFGSFEQTFHNQNEIIWTLSEPYGAKAWWPCKQDLNDKIDNIDVYITTPEINSQGNENIAVANGVQISEVLNNGDKTTHFQHSYPIPAYLIAIAITNYEVYSHQVPNNGNPFPIVNYVYPENLAVAQNDTPVTVPIMNLFSSHFLEYPFADEKYGHAQFGWGGGMEHTTVSFMGNFNRGLIAHELAHQWFGNKVTCGSWQDIWLNEGFATYLTGMTVEDLDGQQSFKNWRQSIVFSITSEPDGAVYIPAQDTTSVSRVFSKRLSYNKGAMVLHMLREKLGDQDFFQGLRNYLTNPSLSYAYAKTENLKDELESQSGLNLTEFFQDWVYSEGYPSYDVTYQQDQSNLISITLNQSQSHNSVDFFEANVPVKLIGTNGEEMEYVFENTQNGEVFQENPGFEVAALEINPDFDIISTGNDVLRVEKTNKNQVILYPNPVSAQLNLKIPSEIKVKQLVFYNTLGQKIKQIKKPKSSISVSELASGLYFVNIITNNGEENKTLIVK